MRVRGGAAVALVAALAFACGSGATSDPGLGAFMRVQDAQFVRGAMPEGVAAGPSVASAALPTSSIWPGELRAPLTGALDAQAVAAAIGLEGDVGYWIVPAGAPDVATPSLPSFRATVSFSSAIVAGQYALAVRAVDGAGTFGAKASQILTATATVPSASSSTAADAPFAVTLAWDANADLDLHVVDPLGNEIFHGNPSSLARPRPGDPDPPDGGFSHGDLSFDSNAQCVIDGRCREQVVWTGAPPSGRYLVRVDTTSLCGRPIAHWTVQALLHGAVIGSAAGTAVDSDAWGAHDRGAGQLALDVDVP